MDNAPLPEPKGALGIKRWPYWSVGMGAAAGLWAGSFNIAFLVALCLLFPASVFSTDTGAQCVPYKFRDHYFRRILLLGVAATLLAYLHYSGLIRNQAYLDGLQTRCETEPSGPSRSQCWEIFDDAQNRLSGPLSDFH